MRAFRNYIHSKFFTFVFLVKVHLHIIDAFRVCLHIRSAKRAVMRLSEGY